MERTEPVMRFAAGGVSAAVIEKKMFPVGVRPVIALELHDGDGWVAAKSLEVEEVPRAVLVLAKAFEAVVMSPARQDEVMYR